MNQEMNPIASHKWERRVLIVSANAPSNIGYKSQEQLLTRGKKGMKERDLVIYKLYDDHWLGPDNQLLSHSQAESIREIYKIKEGTFSVTLIGKDGSVKMRKNDTVSPRELFGLIDSMPMRKNEIGEG